MRFLERKLTHFKEERPINPELEIRKLPYNRELRVKYFRSKRENNNETRVYELEVWQRHYEDQKKGIEIGGQCLYVHYYEFPNAMNRKVEDDPELYNQISQDHDALVDIFNPLEVPTAKQVDLILYGEENSE